MNEPELIHLFAGIHKSTPYQSDAEEFCGMLYSVDSFSEREDFFAGTSAEIIGWNMAAGACSDLLSCGVKPEFLLQSWVIDGARSAEYYAGIASGVEAVLEYYGARCLGGDIGKSDSWSWTAVVGAHAPVSPVRRTASSREPFDLYVSGALGGVNLAVWRGGGLPRLELRSPVPDYALFGTDTSGGFFDALENFRRVNPGLSVMLDEIPLSAAAEDLPFPREFLLIGGAGEYELLYAVPRGMKAEGIMIGRGDFSGNGVRFSGGGEMKNPPPDYRNLSEKDWIPATEQYYFEVFK